jgi:hypothetical protein
VRFLYGWLWRHLPGPPLARVAQLLVIALALVAVCFLWLFPAVAPHLPINQGTLG